MNQQHRIQRGDHALSPIRKQHLEGRRPVPSQGTPGGDVTVEEVIPKMIDRSVSDYIEPHAHAPSLAVAEGSSERGGDKDEVGSARRVRRSLASKSSPYDLCYKTVVANDLNQNDYLDREEFYQFVKAFVQGVVHDNCFEVGGNLYSEGSSFSADILPTQLEAIYDEMKEVVEVQEDAAINGSEEGIGDGDGSMDTGADAEDLPENLSNGIWISVENFEDDFADDVKHVRRICSKTDGAVIANCPPPPRSFEPGESPSNIGSGGFSATAMVVGVGGTFDMMNASVFILIWTLAAKITTW